jgi:hypothetical protein
MDVCSFMVPLCLAAVNSMLSTVVWMVHNQNLVMHHNKKIFLLCHKFKSLIYSPICPVPADRN